MQYSNEGTKKKDKKKTEKKGQYLPSMPTIMTVLWAPNATKNLESSGTRNWANDHSELKYFGKTPGRVHKHCESKSYKEAHELVTI